MEAADLRIALVTPFSWAVPSAVNHYVAELARELRDAGHLPAVVTGSDDTRELRRARSLCRHRCRSLLELLSAWNGDGGPDARLLPGPGTGPLRPEDGIPVLPLGRSFPLRVNGSVANIGLPVDIRSRLEGLLVGAHWDLVHAHEPIAPSLSFTAVRESRSPVLATFHLTPAALVGYELERSLLEVFYRRLDARVVKSEGAAEVLGEIFPGAFDVVPPATTLTSAGEEPTPGTVLYVYRGDDRRGLRAFLHALSGEPPPGLQRLVVAAHRPSTQRWAPRPAPRDLGVPLTWHEFEQTTELAGLYADATAVVAPYLGGEWLLEVAVEAAVAGRPYAAPDVPMVHRFVRELGRGVLFSPETGSDIRSALGRLLDPADAPPPPAEGHDFAALAARMGELYAEALGRTREADVRRESPISLHHASRGGARPVAGPGLIFADLHVHTDHSKDSTSSVEDVLATAVGVGLGALAVADHDTISGALAARELAGDRIQVIVAEEVKTQVGEVIGLFLEEEVPPGLTFDETLGRIKDQGGLVYIPHPFDGLRSTPSYESMVDNLYRIDVIETYNARVALSAFNVNAERFASKYHLVAGAGSDAHVLPGIGTAMLRMRPFRGPEEFLQSLREADILTRRKSLLYLQSLKLLQNTLDHVLPRD